MALNVNYVILRSWVDLIVGKSRIDCNYAIHMELTLMSWLNDVIDVPGQWKPNICYLPVLFRNPDYGPDISKLNQSSPVR